MTCKKCGSENQENAKFCAKCGADLTQKTKVSKETNNASFMDMVKSTAKNVVSFLLKPLDSMKNEDVNDVKKVGITGAFILLATIILNLITSIIDTVRVLKFDWSKGSRYVWDWDNIKNVKWFDLTIKEFFILALVVLGIALIYYLGSIIVKKTVKYQKVVSMVLVAMIPFVVGSLFLSPILGIISIYISVIINIIAIVYSITIFVILINDELNLSGTVKLYYNSICTSTLFVVAYFVILNTVSSLFSSLLN